MSKRVFLLALVIFISDQITKSIVGTYLKLNQSIVVIKNFFNIKYINNFGASFSILKDSRVFLIILSLTLLKP